MCSLYPNTYSVSFLSFPVISSRFCFLFFFVRWLILPLYPSFMKNAGMSVLSSHVSLNLLPMHFSMTKTSYKVSITPFSAYFLVFENSEELSFLLYLRTFAIPDSHRKSTNFSSSLYPKICLIVSAIRFFPIFVRFCIDIQNS